MDSDVLIDLMRRSPAAIAWFASLSARPAVSGFAAIEVTYACRDAAEMRQAQRFIEPFPIVWPSEDDLQRALSEYAPLRLSHGISAFDALVASTAVGRGLPILTFNRKHFEAIPGVITVQPYAR